MTLVPVQFGKGSGAVGKKAGGNRLIAPADGAVGSEMKKSLVVSSRPR